MNLTVLFVLSRQFEITIASHETSHQCWCGLLHPEGSPRPQQLQLIKPSGEVPRLGDSDLYRFQPYRSGMTHVFPQCAQHRHSGNCLFFKSQPHCCFL